MPRHIAMLAGAVVACLGVCILATRGCGRAGGMSVGELAAALREQGVRYTVSETAALPGVAGDGLRLTGEGLSLEVFRIEDRGQLRLAARAATLAAQKQREQGRSQPLRRHVSAPFLIISRQEPTEGQVASALGSVLKD